MLQGDSYASTSRLSICPQVTKRNSFRYSVRMSLTCSNLTPDNQYNDAIKSYAMIKFLKAGGSVALLWGGLSNVVSDSGLRTPTTAGGDQPLPWYFSYKAFKDYFAPGTQIYNTVVSAPESIEALASASHIMLVNKTTKSLTASFNGSVFALSPYQVCVGSF